MTSRPALATLPHVGRSRSGLILRVPLPVEPSPSREACCLDHEVSYVSNAAGADGSHSCASTQISVGCDPGMLWPTKQAQITTSSKSGGLYHLRRAFSLNPGAVNALLGSARRVFLGRRGS